MKTYKEVITKKKVVEQKLCNFCGKDADTKIEEFDLSQSWICDVKISWHLHGPFPGQWGSSSFDMCADCYKDKIRPLMVLPADDDFNREES